MISPPVAGRTKAGPAFRGALLLVLLGSQLLAGCPGKKPPPAGSPTVKPVSAKLNHLAAESSLYLQQHATNPIDWYPWGAAALTRAKQENKLILVSSGFAACHWCHVMDEEVFSQEDVAKVLNASFVCIKVDREEQPELDTQLGAIQQQLTGDAGWPLNVWLTPSLHPFFASTSMEKREFIATCQHMVEMHAADPAKLDAAGEEVLGAISSSLPTKAGALSPAVINAALKQELAEADPEQGGVMARQKFLLPARWRFALQEYRFNGDPQLAAHLRLTLDQIAAGGVYDQVGGGFFRYATDTRWAKPHFEKMLLLNAQLASFYLEAASAFHEPAYRAQAYDVLDFMLRDLQAPEGGFYASLSAESTAGEGAYYVWTRQAVEALAGAHDGPALAQVLGLNDTSVLSGDVPADQPQVPRLELVANPGQDDATAAKALFLKYRPQLLTERTKRPAPTLDHKMITAWNGFALSALARAGRDGTEGARYLAAAQKAAQHLLEVNRRPDGTLLRASTDGKASQPGGVADYALLAQGLFDLYLADGDDTWLKAGLDLLDRGQALAVTLASSSKTGGADTSRAPLVSAWTQQDGPEPSAGADLLAALVEGAMLTDNPKYWDAAAKLLQENGGSIASSGIDAAWWLHGARLLQRGTYSVVLAGDANAPELQSLRQAYRLLDPPNALLLAIPPNGATSAQLAMQPGLADKVAQQGQATAYVCNRRSCLAPVHDPAQLSKQLLQATGIKPAPLGTR